LYGVIQFLRGATGLTRKGNTVEYSQDRLDEMMYGETWGDQYDDAEPLEDDVWADSQTLASAGWGTDEDYGYFGGDDPF
jgi:hypothetical protein